MESDANQVVDQVLRGQVTGHHVVTETQAKALRFRQELEHQAQEVLASEVQRYRSAGRARG